MCVCSSLYVCVCTCHICVSVCFLYHTVCFVCIFFACVESYTTITLTLGMTYPPHSDFTLYSIHFIQDNFTINLDGQLNVFFAIYMFGVCTCMKN